MVGCRRQAERNEEEDGGDNEENDHSPKKQKPPKNPSNPTDYKPRKPGDDDEEDPSAEATRKTGGVESKEGNTSGQQLTTSSKNSNPGNACSGKETDSTMTVRDETTNNQLVVYEPRVHWIKDTPLEELIKSVGEEMIENQGEIKIYNLKEKEEFYRVLNEQRIKSLQTEKKVSRLYASFLLESGLIEYGVHLELASDEERLIFGLQFAKYLMIKGVKPDKVQGHMTSLTQVFTNEGKEILTVGLWDSRIAKGFIQGSKRLTAKESESKSLKKMENTKFDMHFEIVLEALDETGFGKVVGKPPDKIWRHNIGRDQNQYLYDQLTVAIMNRYQSGLMIAFLFNDGIRKSNVMHPSLQMKGRKNITPEELEEVHKRQLEESHGLVNGKVIYAVAKGETYDLIVQDRLDYTIDITKKDGEQWEFVTGQELATGWNKNEYPEETILSIRIQYASTKTIGDGATLGQNSFTVIARRTPMENMLFRGVMFLVKFNFGIGGRPYDPDRLFLSRRPMGDKSNRWHNPVSKEPTDILKNLAFKHGIGKAHAALIGLRKGGLGTSLDIRVKTRQIQEEELLKVKTRGMNWHKRSKVPMTHYLLDNDMKGPFAMVWDREDAVRFGGNYNKWKIRQGMLTDGKENESLKGMREMWNEFQSEPPTITPSETEGTENDVTGIEMGSWNVTTPENQIGEKDSWWHSFSEDEE